MGAINSAVRRREPWNKGKLVGQKAPFKLKEIWAIRIRLQITNRTRDLALFDLAFDSKLRACDLVKLRVRDICHADRVAARDRHAAEDAAPGAVRDHRADPGSGPELGRPSETEARGLPLSQPAT